MESVTPSHHDAIGRLLAEAWLIAVIGLSPDAAKESHQIPRYLQEGYEIVPVYPNADTILGRKSYPSLAAMDERPDVIHERGRQTSARRALWTPGA